MNLLWRWTSSRTVFDSHWLQAGQDVRYGRRSRSRAKQCFLDEKCEGPWIFFSDRLPQKFAFPGSCPSFLWLPSIPRFRCSQSDPALRLVLGVAMTVHSGIFGPVHTGILSGIQLYGALRLQRRLESCSTTSAAGPNRCVPPPCGTTAPPNSGAPLLRVLAHSLLRTPGFALSGRGRLPQSVAFPSSRTTPLTLRHLLRLLGPRAGSPPWRHRSPSASCRVSPSTLRGLLHLLGQSGGFQAATTGLLGDPKNKVFMTIVPEAIDALQLLNSRCVLKQEMENRCRGCDPGTKPSPEGATDTRMGVSSWEVFSCIFLLSGFSLVSSPPAFIVYAGSSCIFLLLSRWLVNALSVLLVVWTCVAYTNSGRKGAI